MTVPLHEIHGMESVPYNGTPFWHVLHGLNEVQSTLHILSKFRLWILKIQNTMTQCVCIDGLYEEIYM